MVVANFSTDAKRRKINKKISLQCGSVKLKDMNNRLHTYFDRTRLERIDYFRQRVSAHYPAEGNAFG